MPLLGPETVQEGGGGHDNGFPMFRTGGGKSVTFKQSTLRNAAAVLGEYIEKGQFHSFS